MKLLLSPHFDDGPLFCAYQMLEHHPFELVCFAGGPKYGSLKVRQAEEAAAMKILGCDWALSPPDRTLTDVLCEYDPERVWAPLPEPGGNSEHNLVGELAARLWPGRVTFYATYLTGRDRSRVGTRVIPQPGWAKLKQRAMACYVSQLEHPSTRPHFERGLAEYVIEPTIRQLVKGDFPANLTQKDAA